MKKVISFITLFSFAIVLISGFIFSSPKEINAQNIGSLRSIETVAAGFSFKKDLMEGDTDPDVKELQKLLNKDIDTMIATDVDGSPGRETTYFGSKTKAAVIKFQNKYKDSILKLYGTTADGKVNKATRTKLNLLLGVFTTTDSVGYPQSRASTAKTTVTPTVVVSKPQTQSTMTTCQFVELLINIGAISSDKSNSARSAVGCSTGTFVDLKVNNSSGSVTVNKNSKVTLSWTTGGVTSCTSGSANKTLSGTQSVTMGTSTQTFTLNCKTSSGTSISDSVTVKIGGAPTLLSTSGYSFGYTTGLFNVNTDVETKLYIIYRTNSSDSKTASFTSKKTTRSEVISGLTPNTTYYFKIKIVNSDGDEFISSEYTGKTSNTPDSTTETSSLSTASTSLSILINGETNYATSTASSTFENVSTVISWESTGFSSCKISSSPIVAEAYELNVATSGKLTAAIYPALYQGDTTFTIACATGTTATNMLYGTVSSLVSVIDTERASSTASTTLADYATAVMTLSYLEEATTTEEEIPAPENQFQGKVVSIAVCADVDNLWEVVIDPCTGEDSADIYERNAEGMDIQTGTRDGQVKITIRAGASEYAKIPSVGNKVIGKSVQDGALICNKVKGLVTAPNVWTMTPGTIGDVAASSAEHVGTLTGGLYSEPDTNGECIANDDDDDHEAWYKFWE